MPQIFNKTPKVTKSGFSIDKAKLTFPITGSAGSGVGLLIQGVECQYAQQLSFLYDLSDPTAVYYVAGRAEGTLNLNKIVGDQAAMQTFYTTFGDVCEKRIPAVFSGLTGCTSQAGSGNITIKDPIITSFGMRMQINEGIISEQVGMKFTDMDI